MNVNMKSDKRTRKTETRTIKFRVGGKGNTKMEVGVRNTVGEMREEWR